MFEVAYAKQFSRPVPGMVIEVLNWSVQAPTKSDAVTPCPASDASRVITVWQTRPIYCDVDGTPKDADFVHRNTLQPSDYLQSPALIVEPQTTTFVGADFTLDVDTRSNLILTRKAL
jgi:N-methylhydantoinase A